MADSNHRDTVDPIAISKNGRNSVTTIPVVVPAGPGAEGSMRHSINNTNNNQFLHQSGNNFTVSGSNNSRRQSNSEYLQSSTGAEDGWSDTSQIGAFSMSQQTPHRAGGGAPAIVGCLKGPLGTGGTTDEDGTSSRSAGGDGKSLSGTGESADERVIISPQQKAHRISGAALAVGTPPTSQHDTNASGTSSSAGGGGGATTNASYNPLAGPSLLPNGNLVYSQQQAQHYYHPAAGATSPSAQQHNAQLAGFLAANQHHMNPLRDAEPYTIGPNLMGAGPTTTTYTMGYGGPTMAAQPTLGGGAVPGTLNVNLENSLERSQGAASSLHGFSSEAGVNFGVSGLGSAVPVLSTMNSAAVGNVSCLGGVPMAVSGFHINDPTGGLGGGALISPSSASAHNAANQWSVAGDSYASYASPLDSIARPVYPPVSSNNANNNNTHGNNNANTTHFYVTNHYTQQPQQVYTANGGHTIMVPSATSPANASGAVVRLPHQYFVTHPSATSPTHSEGPQQLGTSGMNLYTASSTAAAAGQQQPQHPHAYTAESGTTTIFVTQPPSSQPHHPYGTNVMMGSPPPGVYGGGSAAPFAAAVAAGVHAAHHAMYPPAVDPSSYPNAHRIHAAAQGPYVASPAANGLLAAPGGVRGPHNTYTSVPPNAIQSNATLTANASKANGGGVGNGAVGGAMPNATTTGAAPAGGPTTTTKVSVAGDPDEAPPTDPELVGCGVDGEAFDDPNNMTPLPPSPAPLNGRARVILLDEAGKLKEVFVHCDDTPSRHPAKVRIGGTRFMFNPYRTVQTLNDEKMAALTAMQKLGGDSADGGCGKDETMTATPRDKEHEDDDDDDVVAAADALAGTDSEGENNTTAGKAGKGKRKAAEGHHDGTPTMSANTAATSLTHPPTEANLSTTPAAAANPLSIVVPPTEDNDCFGSANPSPSHMNEVAAAAAAGGPRPASTFTVVAQPHEVGPPKGTTSATAATPPMAKRGVTSPNPCGDGDDDEGGGQNVLNAAAMANGITEEVREASRGKIAYAAIRFKYTHGVYFIDARIRSDIAVGDMVVVEGDRGTNIGMVMEDATADVEREVLGKQQPTTNNNNNSVTLNGTSTCALGSLTMATNSFSVSANQGGGGGKGRQQGQQQQQRFLRVLHNSSNKDRKKFYQARRREGGAASIVQRIVEDLSLPIQICDAEFQCDFQKLFVFYRLKNAEAAGATLDLRELQKELYRQYRCRVWLLNWFTELSIYYPQALFGAAHGRQSIVNGMLEPPLVTAALRVPPPMGPVSNATRRSAAKDGGDDGGRDNSATIAAAADVKQHAANSSEQHAAPADTVGKPPQQSPALNLRTALNSGTHKSVARKGLLKTMPPRPMHPWGATAAPTPGGHTYPNAVLPSPYGSSQQQQQSGAQSQQSSPSGPNTSAARPQNTFNSAAGGGMRGGSDYGQQQHQPYYANHHQQQQQYHSTSPQSSTNNTYNNNNTNNTPSSSYNLTQNSGNGYYQQQHQQPHAYRNEPSQPQPYYYNEPPRHYDPTANSGGSTNAPYHNTNNNNNNNNAHNYYGANPNNAATTNYTDNSGYPTPHTGGSDAASLRVFPSPNPHAAGGAYSHNSAHHNNYNSNNVAGGGYYPPQQQYYQQQYTSGQQQQQQGPYTAHNSSSAGGRQQQQPTFTKGAPLPPTPLGRGDGTPVSGSPTAHGAHAYGGGGGGGRPPHQQPQASHQVSSAKYSNHHY